MDHVRRRISPLKAMTADWLEVMDTAHRLGLNSSATMMFGHVETIEDRIEHLERVRGLQDKTKGFTAFIAWTFQPQRRASVLECGDLSPLCPDASSRVGKGRTSPAVQSSDNSEHSKSWRPVAAVVRRRLTSPNARPAQRISHALTSAATLLVLGLALTAADARAQDFALDWFTLDGGGGTSTGGVFTVTGTIGQPDAGSMSGGNYTLVGGFWSIIAALQTEGAPTLSIELTNGLVMVSWPAPAPGWVLTETNRLTGAGSPLWPQVSAAQYQTNAGRIFILTAPPPTQNRYYQLRKPGP